MASMLLNRRDALLALASVALASALCGPAPAHAQNGGAPATAPSGAVTGPVTVFAAASLKEALDEQLRGFSAKSGVTTRVSYAGSNTLAKQIESGAPAHLFISADQQWMDYVAQRQLVVAASQRVLLGNELVLIAPADSRTNLAIAPGFALAGALNGGRLAIANPDAVPAGLYAKAALTRLNVWPSVEQSLARADNVRAALAFVARGEAPLGIVYRTDALAEPRVRVIAAFPKDSHPPIVYPAALVKGNAHPGAQALLDYLSSAAARPVWQRHGFSALP